MSYLLYMYNKHKQIYISTTRTTYLQIEYKFSKKKQNYRLVKHVLQTYVHSMTCRQSYRNRQIETNVVQMDGWTDGRTDIRAYEQIYPYIIWK